MSGFNFDAFNRFFGENYKNNKQFLEVLNEYGVNVKEDAIKKWRQGNAAPKTKDIPGIAKALGVTEQDLFDPSQRERIAKEELRKHTEKYLPLIEKRHRYPVEIEEIAEALTELDEEEVMMYYHEIKAKALRAREKKAAGDGDGA